MPLDILRFLLGWILRSARGRRPRGVSAGLSLRFQVVLGQRFPSAAWEDRPHEPLLRSHCGAEGRDLRPLSLHLPGWPRVRPLPPSREPLIRPGRERSTVHLTPASTALPAAEHRAEFTSFEFQHVGGARRWGPLQRALQQSNGGGVGATWAGTGELLSLGCGLGATAILLEAVS